MPNYPLAKFHFKVDWGEGVFGFSEVSGLSVTQEVITFRCGEMREMTQLKQAGLRKFSNITLKRGIFKGNVKFFEWWDSVTIQNLERRDITITLLNESHEPVVTWNIINAFPSKLDSPNLKADANEVAIESLEIAHEGFTVS